MPKAASLLSLLIFLSLIPFVSGYYGDEKTFETKSETINFDTNIISIDNDFFSEQQFKRYLIFGHHDSKINFLKSSIYSIKTDNGFFSVAILPEKSIPQLKNQGFHLIEDFALDFHNEKIISDGSRIQKISGSDESKKFFNVSGNGTVIAIVDTGVDFSNNDIRHSLARDKNNHPVMLDPDGQGIVLTNSTFFAYIDSDNVIRNYTKSISPHDSSVYVSRDGVFLDITKNGKGIDIPIYNSFFPAIGESPIFYGNISNDMKIGNSNRDYIKSSSGIYHLGVMFQGGIDGKYGKVQVVPVLVVDSHEPGVYDTIIPDMSTSWDDYTKDDLKSGQKPNYDFDFTDEQPIVLGSGNEFLIYDSNGDGKDDYSAGTVGARVLDIYGIIDKTNPESTEPLNFVNGTLLNPIDPDGNYFGVMTDFMGHGTSSAATIVSRGIESYDLYNDTKKYSITGVAPDAKILPVKALWFGDTVYAWLWTAGFDNTNSTWKFSGQPRADIISNSWGISNFPSFDSAPGMDTISLIASILSTPKSVDDDYQGVLMVSSAGNSGHGYGTIGLPNASPFGISVGATTNNIFVGYGPFKDEPRFGGTIDHYNEIVDFSSRGPSILGDPKPDLVSIGAHGFVPSNILKTEKNSKAESFTLFGGTSMAAPMVSGSAALVIEELKKQGIDYDPFIIKNILMSTATDLHNDVFTQGSGLVNTKSSLDYLNGKNQVFVVYNDDSYKNIRQTLEPIISNFNSTEIGFEKFSFPEESYPMTSWFAGQLNAGQTATTSFTIKNPTSEPLEIKINSKNISLLKHNNYDGTTRPRQADTVMNKTGTFVPDFIKLSESTQSKNINKYFPITKPFPTNSTLMVVNAHFPFEQFMNKTADIYADDIKISSLYLYDWIDQNKDDSISADELSLVNRGGSWGTVQELRISEPNKKFDGTPVAGIYPVPTRYSFWLGNTNLNSTSMNYSLSTNFYEETSWSLLWPDKSSITIPANSEDIVYVTIVLPDDIKTGVYQGFLNFQSDSHQVNAPVSFVVKQTIDDVDSVVLLSGENNFDTLYGNGFTKGAFDMTNRYMAGDWRQFYFDITNDDINSVSLELSWESDDTNLGVFVIDPVGKIVQTNVPSGVFGHFMGWPSLDWLGPTPFSQGGGFYPVKNKDDTSTVLFVPINQTGTYSVLTHSTLFGGEEPTESISLAAKFSNIVINPTFPKSPESEIPPTDEKTNDSELISNNPTQSDQKISEQKIIKQTENADDSTFYTGIFLGIGIGVAIGAPSIYFATRRSS
ncbi:MAG: S8 family serine peptidase [Nitrosopumilus sp.]